MASPHKRRGKKLHGSYGKESQSVPVTEEVTEPAVVPVTPEPKPKKKKKSFFNKD